MMQHQRAAEDCVSSLHQFFAFWKHDERKTMLLFCNQRLQMWRTPKPMGSLSRMLNLYSCCSEADHTLSRGQQRDEFLLCGGSDDNSQLHFLFHFPFMYWCCYQLSTPHSCLTLCWDQTAHCLLWLNASIRHSANYGPLVANYGFYSWSSCLLQFVKF